MIIYKCSKCGYSPMEVFSLDVNIMLCSCSKCGYSIEVELMW